MCVFVIVGESMRLCVLLCVRVCVGVFVCVCMCVCVCLISYLCVCGSAYVHDWLFVCEGYCA